MDWFAENWFFIVVLIAFVAMHVFGHGGHGHGGHGHGHGHGDGSHEGHEGQGTRGAV